MNAEEKKAQYKRHKEEFQKVCDRVLCKEEFNINKNIKQFKELCEKIFKSSVPLVDKGEARAGVLGYHPLALLVIALDHIERLENENG